MEAGDGAPALAIVAVPPSTCTVVSTHLRVPGARALADRRSGALSACIDIVIDLSKHGAGFVTNRNAIHKAAKLARQLAALRTPTRGVQKRKKKARVVRNLCSTSASVVGERRALAPRAVSTDGHVMRRVCDACTDKHRCCKRPDIKAVCVRCHHLGLACVTSAVKW